MVFNKKVKIKRKNVVSGIAHIYSTFNNIMITVTDMQGATIAWSSAGVVGYSGSKQSTPFAAQMAAEDVAKKVQVHGVKRLDVSLCGIGSGREAAVRGLSNSGLEICSIRDDTRLPHNGCKPSKRRRV
ncbi:30S ribosomal protein S11 [Holospora obtusa F1]|uniref:Small ribosomal subunit protein uS11 n=1 Tax=Holospora obtusa F1 TaxID=1399147 RepID=W6TI64_HOLOB|nr:30S ribosomal protein S11 [Holospora obtusa]ETZ07700.1 30S ribosomal protein S11 [Holospora obtusa F1]